MNVHSLHTSIHLIINPDSVGQLECPVYLWKGKEGGREEEEEEEGRRREGGSEGGGEREG